MKKVLFIILCFLFIGVVNAKEYHVDDMTINIDESFWNVYTKDNLNEYDADIKNEFKNDVKIYAISKEGQYEFNISSRSIDTVTNLNNLKDDEAKSFLTGFETEFKKYFSDYTLTNYKSNWYKNDYSFVNVSFGVESVNLNLYTTIVNRKQYDLIYYNNDNTKYEDTDFQEEFIDTIKFDVDESMEEIIFSPKVVIRALWDKFKYALIIIVPIIILVIILSKNKKNNKVVDDNNKEFWN